MTFVTDARRQFLDITFFCVAPVLKALAVSSFYLAMIPSGYVIFSCDLVHAPGVSEKR